MDDVTQLAIKRIDDRIKTISMQLNKLPFKHSQRPVYGGQILGLREARAIMTGEAAP
jgi:hypothetical protein